MPTGNGRTLGQALTDLFGQYSRPGGPRTSYTAKSWHAQLVQLTGTQAGYEALARTGLAVQARTLRHWLSTEATPTRANQDRITQAYRYMAGGFDRARLADAQYSIYGVVQQGRDVRDRGANGTSPLRINGQVGRWDSIEEEMNTPHPRPDTIERLFINDVIIEDLGEGSEPWKFPGDQYRVTT